MQAQNGTIQEGSVPEKDPQVDVVGKHAALLSISEVGLGSLLHAYCIPFSGHFLSLNQIFLLSRASALMGKEASIYMPGSISFVAAALKSLSPAGRKLTPMLGIGMQGILYNIGILLCGHTTPGRVLGSGLSSLWGFLQPLLIYYVIFGEVLFKMLLGLDAYRRAWFASDFPSLWYFAGAVVLLKIVLATTIALLSPRVSSSSMALYAQRLGSTSIKRRNQSINPTGKGRVKKIAWLAAKDMCVWPFMACVVLTGVTFWYAEGGLSTIVLMNILRPIAVGYLVFFAMRMIPLEKFATWLEKRHYGIGHAFRIALFKVRQM
jgi:hypothetical protein